MGKGKRLKAARRLERAMQGAVLSWFDAERERLADGPEMACRQCGGPTWVMLAPVPLLRCNDCDWQGLPMVQGPQGLLVPDLDGDMRPAVQHEDGTLEVACPSGTVRITSDGDSVTIATSEGHIRFAFTGHLIEASGDCAHFAGVATRPPRCGCGEWWTRWLAPRESEPVLRALAEERGVELVTDSHGYPSVAGLGGRVFSCAVCGAQGVVATVVNA